MTHFITINNDFRITGGALANYVTGLGTGTDPGTNEPAIWVPAYSDLRWAVYAQADYKLFSRLKLIAGAQYNKTPGVDGNFVPRAGAVLNITSSFGLKALYGQAFKSAAQSEKFTLIPNSNYGNPQLKPENVATTDIQLFFQNKSFQASAGYFRSDMKDIVVRIPYGNIAGAITYANLSQLKVSGWEAEARASLGKAFSLTGSFAYQTNENSIGEKDITAISNTMGKGGIMFSQGGLTIALYNSFFSKPADVINNQSALAANKQRVIVNPVPDAFNILLANVQANLTTIFKWKDAPAVSINLYGDNLLDERVYNPEFSRRVINSLPARGGLLFMEA